MAQPSTCLIVFTDGHYWWIRRRGHDVGPYFLRQDAIENAGFIARLSELQGRTARVIERTGAVVMKVHWPNAANRQR
jgi:hypothetical protein